MSVIRFRVTYKGIPKNVSVPYHLSSTTAWRRLCAEIDQAFHFDKDLVYLVYQSHKDKPDSKVGMRPSSTSSSSVEVTFSWFKDASGIIPLRLVDVNEDMEDGLPMVDIKIGIHPIYHLATFTKATPPTLAGLFAEAKKLKLAAASSTTEDDENGTTTPKELYYLGDDGKFVKIAGEAEWKRVGWRRAVKVFEEAAKEGDWEAAAFHVGPLKLARRSRRSGASTATFLASPPYDLIDDLKVKLAEL